MSHSSAVVKKIMNTCGLKPEVCKVNSHGVSNIEKEEKASRKVLELNKTRERNGRCSRSTILVFVLLITVIAVVSFIAVTYLSKAYDDDEIDAKRLMSFLLISDIHLDIFYQSRAGVKGYCRNGSMQSTYDAPYGKIGCDSPPQLLDEAVHAMKQRAAKLRNLDFVMLSGDTSAHNIEIHRKPTVLGIIRKASEAIREAFPDKPYFPAIGNNDIPGHYVMPVENDTWYSDLLDIWQDGILCKHCNLPHPTTTEKELRDTFLYGGYYKVSIAGGRMILLVLNSMYWTWSTWLPDMYFQERAEKQMMWLEEQLALAKLQNKKAILTSHIPFGIDTYVENVLWLSNFTDMYVDLVANKYSNVVAGQIYAHFHKDSFRFLSGKKPDRRNKKSSYTLLTPSLSPVYNNNPNFRVVHLDPRRKAILDYEQWYMDLVMATEFDNPVWQLDYKFSSRYPPTRRGDKVINGLRIKHLSDNLVNQNDDSFFTGFISSRQVRYQPDPYSRFKYYCAVRHYSQEDYDACQKKYLVPGG